MARSYSLYHPWGEWDARHYVVVIHDGSKRYGYMKLHGKPAKYQHNPETRGMHFVGYMKEKAFEEMIFIDLL